MKSIKTNLLGALLLLLFSLMGSNAFAQSFTCCDTVTRVVTVINEIDCCLLLKAESSHDPYGQYWVNSLFHQNVPSNPYCPISCNPPNSGLVFIDAGTQLSPTTTTFTVKHDACDGMGRPNRFSVVKFCPGTTTFSGFVGSFVSGALTWYPPVCCSSGTTIEFDCTTNTVTLKMKDPCN